MSSHADLHAIPEEELPAAHRATLREVMAAQQEGAVWKGAAPVRHIEVQGVTFVRDDAGSGPQLQRLVVPGVGGVVLAALGAIAGGSTMGMTLMTVGGLMIAFVAAMLVMAPRHREAARHSPTPYGIYLMPDALVRVSPAQAVIHRPEACGVHVLPRGAITAIKTVSSRRGDGVEHAVQLMVRKTTGETVPFSLEGYGSITRQHPLAALVSTWLGQAAA